MSLREEGLEGAKLPFLGEGSLNRRRSCGVFQRGKGRGLVGKPEGGYEEERGLWWEVGPVPSR